MTGAVEAQRGGSVDANHSYLEHMLLTCERPSFDG